MKIVLFIPTAHVQGNKPSAWMQKRLDAAIGYFNAHKNDELMFVISGRWSNSADSFKLTEAEVCKQYVLTRLPNAKIIKEDISVETAGNFAFSKPLIKMFAPQKVVVFNSEVNKIRVEYLANKVFGSEFKYEFIFIDDELSANPKAQDKEPRALEMFKKLLGDVTDGDDQKIREILLYKTPFYFRNLVDPKDFFNLYWPGGFTNKQLTEDSKKGR